MVVVEVEVGVVELVVVVVEVEVEVVELVVVVVEVKVVVEAVELVVVVVECNSQNAEVTNSEFCLAPGGPRNIGAKYGAYRTRHM